MMSSPLLILIVGSAATIVGTVLMLPQVYHSFKTKKVDDISWAMIIAYCLNCALWLTYGMLIAAVPIIITNAIAFCISIVQLILKRKYSR